MKPKTKSHADIAAYIESLEDALMRVQNFPSHTGWCNDDQSDNFEEPASYRQGWIHAVSEIQKVALPK